MMLTICERERVGDSVHTVAAASGVLHPTDVDHLELALKAVLRSRHVVLLDVSDLRVPDTSAAVTADMEDDMVEVPAGREH